MTELDGLPAPGQLPRLRTAITINWVVLQLFALWLILPTLTTGHIYWVGLSLAILLTLAALWATVSYWCVVVLLALNRQAEPPRRDWLSVGSWLIRRINLTASQVRTS